MAEATTMMENQQSSGLSVQAFCVAGCELNLIRELILII